MKGSRLLNLILTLSLLLVLTAGSGQAQVIETEEENQPQGGDLATAALEDAIPVQGRLTDAGGAPLTGDHSVTFSLYDDPAVGNLLCSTNYNPLPMTNGLFNTTVTGCANTDIDGDQLYLGVQVDADAEMTPRQPIYAVPYARSLRPGADIRGEVDGASTLHLYNSSISDNSKGLYAEALGVSGKTYGVLGQSHSPDGFGGFFSGGAADIVLGGTGVDDNGEIDSDPNYTSSDIVLVSNDEVAMHLDEDNDEDGSFRIYNGANNPILGAYETGLVRLNINAGSAMTITVGDRYRDNAIVAWAKIIGTGIGSISSEFGVSSVDHNNPGCYTIYLDIDATNASSLIPIAIAEIDLAPTSADTVRIVSINQIAPKIFDVYINNGNWDLVDNDFVFMVTAR
jgi:hypothetical protein